MPYISEQSLEIIIRAAKTVGAEENNYKKYKGTCVESRAADALNRANEHLNKVLSPWVRSQAEVDLLVQSQTS